MHSSIADFWPSCCCSGCSGSARTRRPHTLEIFHSVRRVISLATGVKWTRRLLCKLDDDNNNQRHHSRLVTLSAKLACCSPSFAFSRFSCSLARSLAHCPCEHALLAASSNLLLARDSIAQSHPIELLARAKFRPNDGARMDSRAAAAAATVARVVGQIRRQTKRKSASLGGQQAVQLAELADQ